MLTAAEPNGTSGQSAEFPTHRGRRTQAAIDAAARTVIARKGILATTIADIAAEAGRSAASFYNYYDSKEAMVRLWALRFRDEANQRAQTVTRHGLSLDWYVHRDREEDEVLPWDHISAGLHRDFLWADWQDALAASGVEDCRWTPCYDCGACTGYGVEHVVASPTPPAGGSQGTGQDLSRGGSVPVLLSASRTGGAG